MVQFGTWISSGVQLMRAVRGRLNSDMSQIARCDSDCDKR